MCVGAGGGGAPSGLMMVVLVSWGDMLLDRFPSGSSRYAPYPFPFPFSVWVWDSSHYLDLEFMGSPSPAWRSPSFISSPLEPAMATTLKGKRSLLPRVVGK